MISGPMDLHRKNTNQTQQENSLMVRCIYCLKLFTFSFNQQTSFMLKIHFHVGKLHDALRSIRRFLFICSPVA